jgi:triosephosphate isomerase
MRKKIVAGNWKMNGQINTITTLVDEINQLLPNKMIPECVLFPPVIYLPLVSSILNKTSIKWGAQNIYPKNHGAFTGEVSSLMLKDYNCSYVLVGHSERRHLFAEDEKFIADKFHHVKEHDMIPILCVGETLEQREQGYTKEVIASQLRAVVGDNSNPFSQCVIAYEPVWAIGTGRSALPEQVQETHAMIRALVAEFSEKDAANVSLLYGGSVNEKNAQALFSMPDVDGGLIGGASLHAQQFVEIVKCIN